MNFAPTNGAPDGEKLEPKTSPSDTTCSATFSVTVLFVPPKLRCSRSRPSSYRYAACRKVSTMKIRHAGSLWSPSRKRSKNQTTLSLSNSGASIRSLAMPASRETRSASNSIRWLLRLSVIRPLSITLMVFLMAASFCFRRCSKPDNALLVFCFACHSINRSANSLIISSSFTISASFATTISSIHCFPALSLSQRCFLRPLQM